MRLLLIIAFSSLSIIVGGQEKYVSIKTIHGTIIVKLANETSLHRDNFVKLVKEKYFDKTQFHRAVPRFVIQGGDPDSIFTTPADTNILKSQRLMPEFRPNLIHKRGALGMGSDDNILKASFFTQFYIVVGRNWTDAQLDTLEQTRLKGRKISAENRSIYKAVGGTPHLDGNYTVFGEVVRGMDVVDKISLLPNNKQMLMKPVGMKVKVMRRKAVKRIVNSE